MKIIIGEKAGCCFGVQRALEIAAKTRAERSGTVVTLGPLIHNARIVSELAGQGVGTVKTLDEVGEGTVIIRSHGAGPHLFQAAADRQIEVVDATCPFVRLEQELAVALKNEGYTVVVVGERDHAEVRSITEWLAGQALVVSPEEVNELPWGQLGGRVGIVSQTTQSIDGLAKVVSAILPRCRELKIHNTICRATVQRQQEVKELSQQADLLLVVGGKDSANTRRLAEIGREQGVLTFHVESAEEIEPSWAEHIATVAVTAGASTPRSQIQEVVDRLAQLSSGGIEVTMENENLNETPVQDIEEAQEVQEVQKTQETQEVQEVQEVDNNEEDFAALMQSVPRRLEEGMILKARVVLVRDDAAYVDLGWKSDLPVPLAELTTEDVLSAKAIVKPGDEIRVMVVRSKDLDEPFMLSKRRADQESAWMDIEEKMQGQATVTGKVTKAVKGGLELDIFGARAFLPASQISLAYVEDLSTFVGQELTCKITEFDPDRKKLILSRRPLLEEERRKAEERIYEIVKEGEKVKGKVTRLAPFGAFVDLGGVDGLIHLSELSWERVNKAEDAVKVGDEVEVLVQKIDKAAKRISLSMKQLRPHPWDRVQSQFSVGDVVEGQVVRLAPFGAFVALAEGVDGLVHISQLSHERIKEPKDAVSVGQTVQAKIVSIDPTARRIGLSIKDLTPAPVFTPVTVAAPVAAIKPKQVVEVVTDDVKEYLNNQENGRLQSSLADLFEKK